MSINEGCANQKNEMIKNGNKGEAVMKAYTPVPTKFYTFAFHHTYTHTQKEQEKQTRQYYKIQSTSQNSHIIFDEQKISLF